MRPRIHWCATGAFALTPLHAAGVYDGPNPECCSDYVVSSYTPTLVALSRAQQRAPVLKVSESRLAVIAAEQAQDRTLSKLPKVKEEITCIRARAERAKVSVNLGLRLTTSTLRQEVSSQFESAQLVHVACHGVQDPKLPLKSRFCVSDGDVSVEELMNLNLKDAFLAFLSACETAKGDEKQPDQTIHLAATMLFVGFKSVVATLW
jgi:CHAT domain-containing protein